MRPSIPFPFSEPTDALAHRRHGPSGLDYRRYKPWLRDEHQFRCVYCLAREAWDLSRPARSDSFGADHMISQRDAPHLANEYSNLCYCCSTCNPRKNAASLPRPLIEEPLADHLTVGPDGSISAKSGDGRWLMDLLLLDAPARTLFRRKILELYQAALVDWQQGHHTVKTQFFSFPKDQLPNLRSARPPSNTRPEGIEESAFARNERGELPEFY